MYNKQYLGVKLAGAAAGFLAENYLNMPKRASSRTMTRRKKRRVMQDRGGYNQLVYDREYAGRYLSKQAKFNKLMRSHATDVIERFQNVTNISDGAGAYYLSWDDSPVTAVRLPCYIMDLTCIKNRMGDSVTTGNPYPFMRLERNRSYAGVQPGAYITSVVSGRTQDNVSTNTWQLEKHPQTTLSSAVEKAFIDWCDIRLVMYGARKTPSWVQVMVVQFMDEEQVPGLYSDLTTVSDGIVEVESGRLADPDDPTYNRWQTAWQGFVDNCTGSTIATRDVKEQSLRLKVKYSKTYRFNPTMSVENDPTGHQVSLKFRYAMNKVCTYFEDPQGHEEVLNTAANNEEKDPNFWGSWDQHSYSLTCAPKGREFLIIKGFSPRAASDYNTGTITGTVVDFAPSFDMMVRRRRTWIRN